MTIDVPTPEHSLVCRLHRELIRQRTIVSLDYLSQPQAFLIRALVHGLGIGIISTDALRAIPRTDLTEAESATAALVYQSGALDAYEGWLA
jgi:hypothetical protein